MSTRELTLADFEQTVSGEGSLFRGHAIDAAAPKFQYAAN